MSPHPSRVLHLIAAEPARETDLTGLLDAALLAASVIGGVAVSVGPWKDAPARAKCLGVPLADACPAPAGIPEFARGRIAQHWKHRPIDLVHCWGAPAASLARLALPRVPRVCTPLKDPRSGEWQHLRDRALRSARIVFLHEQDERAWRTHGIEGDSLPAPSTRIELERDRVRRALGLEPTELALFPITDACDGARAAASLNTLAKLAVADIFITGMINIGPHTRRARTLASNSPVRMRILPSRGTLPESLSAADVACWGPEPSRPRSLAAAWCQRTLLATALRSGVPSLMPHTPATEGLVPEQLAPILRTPDASSTGVAHAISRHLRCSQRRAEITQQLADNDSSQAETEAFRRGVFEVYAETARVSAERETAHA